MKLTMSRTLLLEGQVASVTHNWIEPPHTSLTFIGSSITAATMSHFFPSILEPGSVVRLSGHFDETGVFRYGHVHVYSEPGATHKGGPVSADPSNELWALEKASTRELKDVVSEAKDIEAALIAHLKRHPECMRQLNPEVFEKLIAEILADQGFEVEWSGRARNTAADVLAVRKTEGLGLTERYNVECKRHAERNRVGVELVRTLYGSVVDERASGGILVTTSFYEKGALAFAHNKFNLHLKEG